MIKRALFTFCGGLLLLGLFLFPSAHVSAASSQRLKPFNNFAATCKQINVDNDGFLTAMCPAADGSNFPAILDLNERIGNNNGHLIAKSGGFVPTCQNIGGAITLSASCFTANHKLFSSSLDLNPLISNINGSLKWS